jgi:peptide/nickel transport system permease protein
MTSPAETLEMSQATDAVGEGAPRNYWRQVLHDTVAPRAARFGIGWIAIVAVAGVFAPLLANTMPILAKIDGRISSPMARALTVPDITLLVLVGWSLVRLVRRCAFGRWMLEMLILTAVMIPLAILFAHPPDVVDWPHYRNLDRQGEVQWKVMAPIPYSPYDFQRDIPDAALQPPTRQHLLGTDAIGGDVCSRMIHACRVDLSIGLIATGIAVVIGVAIGGLMGYFAGWVDLLGMRLIEIFESIPTLFLLVTFVAFFPPNLYMIMAIIGLTTWTSEARFIRAEFLRLRKQDFVQAAISQGLPLTSVLFRHMLPNGIYPILITSSFGIASAILSESTLSFLGIGLSRDPSWGALLEQALGAGGTFVWWIALFPGLAIFLTVFGYNLVGEAMRDALDPKLRT